MHLRHVACLAALLPGASHAKAQAHQALKTYRDPQYGVTFTYPANWDAGPNLQPFYLLTDILQPIHGSDESDTPYEQARMKAGFRNSGPSNYDRTNLDGIEFVYFMLPQTTSAACYARITDLADLSQGDHRPIHVTIHGVTYLHLTTGDAGLGHGAGRELYAAYMGTCCYLFEEGIHTYNGGDHRFLTSKQNLTVKRQLAAVMQSVRIDRALIP